MALLRQEDPLELLALPVFPAHDEREILVSVAMRTIDSSSKTED